MHFNVLVIGDHTSNDLTPWYVEYKAATGNWVSGTYGKADYFVTQQGGFRFKCGAPLRYLRPEDPVILTKITLEFLRHIPDMIESIDTPEQANMHKMHKINADLLRRLGPIDKIEIGHLDLDAMDADAYERAGEDWDFANEIESKAGKKAADALRGAFKIEEGQARHDYCAQQKWHVAAILDMIEAKAGWMDGAWKDDYSYMNKEEWPGFFSGSLRYLQKVYPECLVALYHCHV